MPFTTRPKPYTLVSVAVDPWTGRRHAVRAPKLKDAVKADCKRFEG